MTTSLTWSGMPICELLQRCWGLRLTGSFKGRMEHSKQSDIPNLSGGSVMSDNPTPQYFPPNLSNRLRYLFRIEKTL